MSRDTSPEMRIKAEPEIDQVPDWKELEHEIRNADDDSSSVTSSPPLLTHTSGLQKTYNDGVRRKPEIDEVTWSPARNDSKGFSTSAAYHRQTSSVPNSTSGCSPSNSRHRRDETSPRTAVSASPQPAAFDDVIAAGGHVTNGESGKEGESVVSKLESFVASMGSRRPVSQTLVGWKQQTNIDQPPTSATSSSGAAASLMSSASTSRRDHHQTPHHSIATSAAISLGLPRPPAAALSLLTSSFDAHSAAAADGPLDLSNKKSTSHDRNSSFTVRRHSRSSSQFGCSSSLSAARRASCGSPSLKRRYEDLEEDILREEDGEDGAAVDTAASSLVRLQRQFGENSSMLDRIGARHHPTHLPQQQVTATGVGAGPKRLPDPLLALHGNGLYGLALHEPPPQPPVAAAASPLQPVTVPHNNVTRRQSSPSTKISPKSQNGAGPAADVARSPLRSSSGSAGRGGRRLVRGQDAWMNGDSGRQRRCNVLRCLECSSSFRSLPELTLHMIHTAHYANIVRATMTSLNSYNSAPNSTQINSNTTSGSAFVTSDSDDDDSTSGGGSRDDVPTGNGCKRQRIWRPEVDEEISPRSTAATERRLSTSSRLEQAMCSPAGSTGSVALEADGDVTPRNHQTVESSRSTSSDSALTAMEDFISRSLVQLDQSKSRAPALSSVLLPSVNAAAAASSKNLSCPPQSDLDRLLPSTMFAPGSASVPAVAQLAQFFPEQFILAGQPFGLLPFMYSMARVYQERWAAAAAAVTLAGGARSNGLTKLPSSPPVQPSHRHGSRSKIDVHDISRISTSGLKPTSDGARQRDNGSGSSSMSPPDRLSSVARRPTTDDIQTTSPTSSSTPGSSAGLSLALASLSGFVYGQSFDERTRASRNSTAQAGGSCPATAQGRPSSSAVDAEATSKRRTSSSRVSPTSHEASTVKNRSGVTATTEYVEELDENDVMSTVVTDYDSRFDKYYRLARELSGH